MRGWKSCVELKESCRAEAASARTLLLDTVKHSADMSEHDQDSSEVNHRTLKMMNLVKKVSLFSFLADVVV